MQRHENYLFNSPFLGGRYVDGSRYGHQAPEQRRHQNDGGLDRCHTGRRGSRCVLIAFVLAYPARMGAEYTRWLCVDYQYMI